MLIIIITVLIFSGILFRHRNLFLANRTIRTNDQITKMYDGTQEIFVINDYTSAKIFCGLKTERTYEYLGYVFNKLLKYCIGVRTGDEWLAMKKPLTPFFNTESVKYHFRMICEKADSWINDFDTKLNVSESSDGIMLKDLGLDKLSLSVLSTIIYGNLSQDQLNELYELSLSHNKLMTVMGTDMKLRCPVMSMFPSGNKTMVDEFWNRWSRFNDEIKDNKEYQTDTHNTLFNVMIKSEVYSSDKLKFYQTLYEIVLFNLDLMIDGFANLIQNVALNPESQSRIFDEIETHDIYSFDGINNLEYAENTIYESARLNPGIILTFAETLVNDEIISGVSIKKGSKITLNTKTINQDPKIWDDPEMFRPTRFTQENKHAFHRFGLGARKCLGNVYANQILKIGLIKLIQKYTFSCNGSDKKIRNTIVNLNNYDMIGKIIFKNRK